MSTHEPAVNAAAELVDAGRLAGDVHEPDEDVVAVQAAFDAGGKSVTRRPPPVPLGGFDVIATVVGGRALVSMRCGRHSVPAVLVPATGIRREGGMCQNGLGLVHLVDMAARHEREHHLPEGGADNDG